ncbi:MAG TPA: potassium/proton antiporter [Candidatus Omnitrophota bacterium]|nr:potassium/proton antiporter [Candidatus Omnitrophota bacterium]HRY85493.1 potassium/proton antiporter [Candidatus Omnitrophota bacterium]
MFDVSWSITTEQVLLAAACLLFLGVLSSKLSDRFSIPSLVLFMGIGMLAGSEGIGGIDFNNAALAKTIGVIALSFILFSGGLETDFREAKRVFAKGITLSTLGVLITAGVVGVFASWIFRIPVKEGLLLGAIISSTDAAAVFSILRSKNISLKGQLRPLLELESGSNDPMAVFLTLGMIQLIQHDAMPWHFLIGMFLRQMALGFIVGWAVAEIFLRIIKRLRLEYEGLYAALTFSVVLLAYGAAETAGGNGFLSVYLVGLLLSRKDFFYKRNLVRFHAGLAWLMQITMFVTLGLLVFPSQLVPIAWGGIATALVLFFVARPVSIFLCLPFDRFREKLMISWVGLRGAAPIVLATFPLLAKVSNSELIFDVVFFVVLVSVLIQGTSIPVISKWLRLHAPLQRRPRYPLEFEQHEGVDAELLEFFVPYGGKISGKRLYDLNFPQDSLAVLVGRNDKFIVAKGNTLLEDGDVVLVLVGKKDIEAVKEIFGQVKEKKTSA